MLHKSRLPLDWHHRKGTAAPATQQIGTPYNPLDDLPALPPFRSADAVLNTGTIVLSVQPSTALDVTLPRLQPLLEARQRRHFTTKRLVEVCLLMSAADIQMHGADSQIVRILGHQVTHQPVGTVEKDRHVGDRRGGLQALEIVEHGLNTALGARLPDARGSRTGAVADCQIIESLAQRLPGVPYSSHEPTIMAREIMSEVPIAGIIAVRENGKYWRPFQDHKGLLAEHHLTQ